jgi:hypothetical protein
MVIFLCIALFILIFATAYKQSALATTSVPTSPSTSPPTESRPKYAQDNENVHDSAIVEYLRSLYNDLSPRETVSRDRAYQEMCKRISDGDALLTLRKIWTENSFIVSLDQYELDILAKVWSVIRESDTRQLYMENLSLALADAAKISGSETFCPQGRVGRILQIFEIVNPQRQRACPVWVLREEIFSLCAKYRETLYKRLEEGDKGKFIDGDTEVAEKMALRIERKIRKRYGRCSQIVETILKEVREAM